MGKRGLAAHTWLVVNGKVMGLTFSGDSSSSDTPYSESTSPPQSVEEAHFVKDIQVNKKTQSRGWMEQGLEQGLEQGKMVWLNVLCLCIHSSLSSSPLPVY